MPPKKPTGTPAPKPADLAKAIAKAEAALLALEAELEKHGVASLTAAERLHSNGRLRDGETVAMVNILDTVDAFPDRFGAIAAHDHGVDDEKVETGPSRQALARYDAFAPLRAVAARLAAKLDDDALASGGLVRDVTTPAYAIIKANAAIDPALRKKASAAIDFYSKASRKKAPKPGTTK